MSEAKGGTGTILILGYGAAGLPTARLLLRETDVQLILTGRNFDRLQEAVATLQAEFAAERIEGRRLDASDAASLDAAFEDCDMVLVTIPITGIGGRIARAALKAGIDYVDINVDEAKARELQDISRFVEKAGRCFLTDAGIFPGTPSVLASLAARRLEALTDTAVFAYIRDAYSFDSARDGVVWLGTAPYICRDGSWRRASLLFDARKSDFGSFGLRTCYPVHLHELRSMPAERLRSERAGAYMASVHPIIDLAGLLCAMLRLDRSERGIRLGARMIAWSTRRFAKPPLATIIKMEAIGTKEARTHRMVVSLEHEDGYVATAIPVVAALLQMLDGSARRPGVHVMGHIVDPGRHLEDMERMGMKVRLSMTEVAG
jgi:saccharopine dehydrogenase (NAD+, L-lysine-forming)